LLTAGTNRTSRDQSHGCIVLVQHRRCLVRGRCSFRRSPCGLPPAGPPGGILLRLDVLLQPPPRPSCVPRGRQSGSHALLRASPPPQQSPGSRPRSSRRPHASSTGGGESSGVAGTAAAADRAESTRTPEPTATARGSSAPAPRLIASASASEAALLPAYLISWSWAVVVRRSREIGGGSRRRGGRFRNFFFRTRACLVSTG
jgi:hypothetical protein